MRSEPWGAFDSRARAQSLIAKIAKTDEGCRSFAEKIFCNGNNLMMTAFLWRLLGYDVVVSRYFANFVA